MKRKYESICTVIGSLVGAVGSGIAVYLTKSSFSILIVGACYYYGSWIGKNLDKTSN